MPQTPEQIAEAADFVRSRLSRTPQVGVILGSGLGGLANGFADPEPIPYTEIPHFTEPTALGHAGRLVGGRLGGAVVVAMQGRTHAYEGRPIDRVAMPVRVIRALGANVLIVSNAAGGLNPQYKVGDVMVIDDHLNLMFRNPLLGLNSPRFGPRWPDMSSPYNPRLANSAQAIACRENFICHRGVYVGMLGPTYETRAEYRMLRRIGGDVVGMSTVPEVIVAAQLGMHVLGISAVTNVCSPDVLGETSGEAVIAAAASATEKLTMIVKGVIGSLDEEFRQA